MRVMVTGGTGFVGGHSVKALADAGHEIQLLVRDPVKIDTTLQPLGVEGVDFVVGDMTDVDAVTRAMDGCDAVLHSAAVVTLDPRRAAEIEAANPRGAQVVLEAAIAHGADPIVVVSSASALFTPGVPLMHSDLPPTDVKSGYGRSKADAEHIARRYQEQGAPVTISYPGGVLGPPIGSSFGEAAEGVVTHLKNGGIFRGGATTPMIDVRDVAAIHAAAMEPGRGPRRYMCAGYFVTMNELAARLRTLTGRRVPVIPAPAAAFRLIGRAFDAAARVTPLKTVYTEEAMAIYTQWPPSDDHLVRKELGVTLRPLEETLADTIRALVAAGRLSGRQAGRLSGA